MEVYKHEVVSGINEMYGELLRSWKSFDSIAAHLEALSLRLWEEVSQGNPLALQEVRNYHWSHLGQAVEVLKNAGLTEADCKQTIANEYGYRRWSEVKHVRYPYHVNFENSVELLLQGDEAGLRELLSGDPALINQKSQYGHRATLLHYAVSNGVELWRQSVPLNLPRLVEFLLDNGANPRAKMKVYNGEYTASELLMSSEHPRAAGVLSDLRDTFNKAVL
ncbi:hypothetical protein PP178_06140 [Zeaxanthinibacter sp. PT1]|uniref:hypothetical protein n=1 Tax=Zeaxanthinibacter TaxID=561554 RepID=UPI00234A9AFE|nr:hypothetical protein [Zeaxanthinibacter sp. PT1]MDC6351127.1 hypothetical protein [Zeaxanthinibacter sp. PT1]